MKENEMEKERKIANEKEIEEENREGEVEGGIEAGNGERGKQKEGK